MSKAKQSRERNQLRIIGGKWRGRKLHFPSVPGLRPTGDRIRETLFNWLRPYLANARCLDLFAGSGALGFEALSQGAASAVMLDRNNAAVQQLRQNCQLLNTDAAIIAQTDALAWLQQPTATGPFTIVFLDPPFDADLLAPTSQALEDSGLLHEQALIYLEASRQQGLRTPANWRLIKQKLAGSVSYCLYQRY